MPSSLGPLLALPAAYHKHTRSGCGCKWGCPRSPSSRGASNRSPERPDSGNCGGTVFLVVWAASVCCKGLSIYSVPFPRGVCSPSPLRLPVKYICYYPTNVTGDAD